uniref:Uncharacterized protein n=1 Tax=Brassica campestris TaxID=3711 RepID=M4F934_BRACM
MFSSTRSNKEKYMLFSEDRAHLERTIHKDQRSTSLDAEAFTSTDTRTQTSTDTRPSLSTDIPRSTSTDTTPRSSIDPQSQNMVAVVILKQDENGNLYDQDGHQRNATGQKLDAQGTVIPDADATVNVVELGNELGYIAACHCGAEYETEYSESLDTYTVTSINSYESPMIDESYPTSLDGRQPVDYSTSLDQYYPDFAFEQPNKNRLETVILSSNEDPTEEYDEDHWKKRDTEIALQDERYSTNPFNNTPTPSIDGVYSASIDSHPHPAKQLSSSIDMPPATSIDIKAAASEKQGGNIPIPISNKFNKTYIRSFAPKNTSHETEAGNMSAPTNQSEGTSRKSIQSKNPNSAEKRLPSIDKSVSTSIDSHSKPQLSLSSRNISIDYDFLLRDEFGIFRDQDGNARATDGKILQVSREDIADIIQLANEADYLFTQQRSIPANNPTVPDKFQKATTT